MPCGTKAPKEMQHHLPTLVLRRPSVSAQPPDTPTGVRGSRMRDRRPPTYRCPAVPGHVSPARAILMVLDSSVLPSEPITCKQGLHTAGTAAASTAVLLTAAPRHFRPPGPVVSPVAVVQQPGFETPPPHRHTRTAARQFVSAGPCSILATRETIITKPSNVYSSQHRFSAARRGGLPLGGSAHTGAVRSAGPGTARRPRFSAPSGEHGGSGGLAGGAQGAPKGSRMRPSRSVAPPSKPPGRAGA